MEAGLPTLDKVGPSGNGSHYLDREHVLLDLIPLRGALFLLADPTHLLYMTI